LLEPLRRDRLWPPAAPSLLAQPPRRASYGQTKWFSSVLVFSSDFASVASDVSGTLAQRWLVPTILPTAAASALRRGRRDEPMPVLDAAQGARAALWIAARTRAAWRGLTFELTPTVEAGAVSLD
jgi:hypothetical protein